MNERRLGLLDVPLMPESTLDSSCVVNGDAMIWVSESARRYCRILDEELPKPTMDDCSQTDATPTSYLTFLQSTEEFDDEYQFYLKEEWGERVVFTPYTEIPSCQDQNELPRKRGVVQRKVARALATNKSTACQLLVNATACLQHGGCEWRSDFGGRCRLGVPSTLPTLEPTIMIFAGTVPTPIPTAFHCAMTEDGETMDPGQYLALAHPDISPSYGTAFALAPPETLPDGGSFQRQFGFFNAGVVPGSSFGFRAGLAGVQVGVDGGAGSTTKAAASSVAVVLKSSTIYHDSRKVCAAFQVHDAAGRTHVSTSGLVLTMTMNVPSASSPSSQSAMCGSPDATSGIGECALTASPAFFSTSANVAATVSVSVKYSGSTVAMSSAAVLSLSKEPTFDALSSAGMIASLPHHPQVAGGVITVDVRANTNGQALNVWVLVMSYDLDVLTYESTSTSLSYASAVVTSGAGTVAMSTSGVRSTTLLADVTGSSVEVVTLTFKVKSGTNVTTHRDVLGLFVAQMVNEASIAFANDVPGQVNDERGAAQTSGQMTVKEVTGAGLFAYAPINELVNVAPLSGSSVSSVVSGMLVYDDADEGNEDVASAVSCNLTDPASASSVVLLASDNGCTVKTTSTHLAGAAAVRVRVSLGGLTTSVSFRVWFPTKIALDVSDDDLGILMPSTKLLGASSRLARAVQLNGTCSMRYQKAALRAYATFLSGNALLLSSSNVTVDVTDLVAFESSDVVVATVGTSSINDAAVLEGHAPGVTEVSVVLSAVGHPSVSMNDATVAVQVSQDVPAMVEELTVVVYTGISWTNSVGSVALLDEGAASVTLKHELSAEGHTASVAVYANFDDGTYEDVTGDSSLLSLLPSSLGVLSDDDSGSKGVVVEVGADTVCYPALEASLSVCGVAIAEGHGVVMLDMPEAVSVTVSPSSSKMTRVGDGASLEPFNVATMVSLSVMVGFDDGSFKSFSSDTRTAIAVVSDGSDTMVELHDDQSLTVLPSATIRADSSLARVLVSFPGTFAVSATGSVRVVELANLSVSSQPYPAVGGFLGNAGVLRLVACSGIYQRLEATATAVLSDGTQQTALHFYKRVAFTSSDPSVADFTSVPSWSGMKRGLVATQAGRTIITGLFGGLNASTTIRVEDVETGIDSLTIASDIGSSGTLRGVAGTRDSVKVTASFEDGTSIAIATSGQTLSSSWLSPWSLLNFSSAVESAVTVSRAGMLELKGNYYGIVELSAMDVCGSGTTATRGIYANLDAEYHDVDLGSETGAPFGTVDAGESFDVEVRVQGSGSYDMTAFQIVVTFDSSVVRVTSDAECTQGGDWSSSFECTTNDPVDEVLVVGSCGLSPSSGCGSKGLLTVATITFTAIAGGTTEITGDIVKIKDDSTTTVDALVVAGTDELVVVGARRLTDVGHDVRQEALRDTAVSHRRDIRRRSRRRLENGDCAGMVLGDTNGDCTFDVEDVQYLQRYIGGSPSGHDLSPQQQQAVDPDMDGDSDGVDIDYLMKVLANKYRFLVSFNSSVLPFSLSATLRTSSSELAVSAQTAVLYEIGTEMNDVASLFFLRGTEPADTADGIVVTGEVHGASSPGVFVVEAANVAHSESSVGVVIIIRTSDANGDTSESRQFSFYCSRLVPSCASVYGDSSAAFQPFDYASLLSFSPTEVSVNLAMIARYVRAKSHGSKTAVRISPLGTICVPL